MGATTDYQENIGVDQGGHAAVHRYHGIYDVNDSVFQSYEWGFRHGPNIVAFSDIAVGSGSLKVAHDTYVRDVTLPADSARVFRAYLRLVAGGGTSFGAWLGFQSYAVTATASIPTSSSITSGGATIACDYVPNTNESTASVKLEYRLISPPGGAWTQAGAADVVSGYAQLSISRAITGLSQLTTYEYRLSITRTTANDATLTSSISTFTTTSDAPVVATAAATTIGARIATLNGTVDPNAIACRVRFGYGTSDGGGTPGAWANLTAYQTFSADGVQGFAQPITGLNPSTAYFFRAFVEWPSPGFASSASDVTLGFSTLADPAIAAKKARMPRMQVFPAKYGVATDVYFSLDDIDTSNNNKFINTAAGSLFLEAADVKYSKDNGVTWTNVGTLPTKPGSAAVYKLSLTASEMQGSPVLVMVVDNTGTVWRDLHIQLITRALLGQFDIDISALAGNNDALKLTPSGTGYGMNAGVNGIYGVMRSMVERFGICPSGGLGGTLIQLDAATSGLATDYFKGALIILTEGAGAGQGRAIVGFTPGTQRATVDRAWLTNPDATTRWVIMFNPETFEVSPLGELTAMPDFNSSYGKLLQFVFQRFAYLRTQTVTTMSMFHSTDTEVSTPLATGSVNDNGTRQLVAKLT